MNLERAAGVIAASSRVVALTGAGVSAESGVPTFRDPGGIWERFDPEEVATADGFLRFLVNKPWAAIEFLRGLRDTFATARPNPGHVALAELERDGHLRAVVTQNVDGLHQEAGSTRVIEVHGTFSRRRCLVCERREPVTREQFVADMDEMIAKLGSYMVSHPAHVLRRCDCGGLFRSDFVAFGEPVQDMDRAVAEAQGAEVLLVCGTSGMVWPAAGLPEETKRAGGIVVEVNLDRTELSDLADVRLKGPAGEMLPELLRRVREHTATQAAG